MKAIEKMDRPTKQRVKTAIEKIPGGDIKPLKGSINSYRLHIGDLRIIFAYRETNTVIIQKIASRGEIYKGV